MADELTIADEVSKFLQNSCDRRTWYFPQIESIPDFCSARHPVNGTKCRRFQVCTGSVAEFYIEPMMSCIGDVDIMYHYNNELAIPYGQPPPSELPSEFNSRVKVFEIIDNGLPGYVHLMFNSILSNNCGKGRYTVMYLSMSRTSLNHALYVNYENVGARSRGSARWHCNEDITISPVWGTDTMPICIQCHDWPTLATDWPTQQMNSTWPDVATEDTFATNWRYSSNHRPIVTIHGPARRYETVESQVSSAIITDTVPCIRCLEWPTQASNWPTRQRKFEWPDMATVGTVVKIGCDLVGVAHPCCKDDENHQWRLSFSRAEIVLLNSWTREQQIVYHMLRIFVKSKRLTDLSKEIGLDTFSNYHIKTLMLWASELNPRSWWIDGSNLIYVCINLMRFLVEWLTTWRGQHYFIDEVQFSDHFDPFNFDTVIAVAESTTVENMSEWFVHHYVRKCAELCPDTVSLLCCDPLSREKVHKATMAVVKWKDHISRKTLLEKALSDLLRANSLGMTDLRDTLKWFGSICCIGSRLFFQSFARPGDTFSLAYMQTCAGCVLSIVLDAVDMLDSNVKIECVQAFVAAVTIRVLLFFGNERRMMSRMRSNANLNGTAFELTRATALMELAVQLQCEANTFKLAHIKGSILFLRRALIWKHSCGHNNPIYCLVNIYLAVLYYVIGQFQRAMDHCMLVARSKDHSHYKSHAMQGKLLPKVDGNVDNALGLAVLYQYILLKATNQERSRSMSVLTPDLFALYFVAKHLLVAKYRLAPKPVANYIVQAVKNAIREQLSALRRRLLNSKPVFISDLMLCKIHISCCLCCTTKDVFAVHSLRDTRAHNTFAVFRRENPVNYGQLPRYRTLATNNTADFHALTLHRCGLHEQCMEMCERSLHGLEDQASRLMSTHYEFIQLLDNDIVSLIGLSTLLNRAGRQSKLEDTLTVNQLVLTLYLLTQSRIKVYAFSKDQKTLTASMAETLCMAAGVERVITNASYTDHLMLKLTERRAVVRIKRVFWLVHRLMQ